MNDLPLSDIDFSRIKDNSTFKEDSVREVIVLPIIKALGYNEENIVRSKTLEHPFLKIGSRKRPLKLIPDYLIKIEDIYAWTLDAKSPSQSVLDSEHIEQVYSYASHPEIRSAYFALCNGLEFALFRREQTNKPLLYFHLDQLSYYWNKLKIFLSPTSFQAGKNFEYDLTKPLISLGFNYLKRPMLKEIIVRKQAAKRHFGVHGYFTKQSWNVVAEYIKNYTKPGDLVLDPYAGSGITAIEAMMNNRKAINIDLNPMAVFIVSSLIAPVDHTEFLQAFERVKENYLLYKPKNAKEIKQILKKFKYPKSIKLPKGSDVDSVEKLFSKKQLAQLACLKAIIINENNLCIRNSLLLAFSSSITKSNLTYHNSTKRDKNAGNAAPFAYYRYRVAKEQVELDLMSIFEAKVKRVLAAKKEMEYFINKDTISNIQVIKGSATDLSFIPDETVDYIYTDPPYGKKIPYLDLSVMWNAWLDLEVTDEDYKLEAIEDGELDKSKSEYNSLIAESIKEMYRVLKFDRWMSFVFAHKDPEFWHLIIETAESCGFEYVGAVPQKNGQTSFKKRQNPFTVLSGQLIINFRKTHNPRAILKANLGMNIAEIVFQTIEGIIAKNDGATLEQINDELIIKGLELGFLDLLKKQYSDLTPILMDNFDYNEETEVFTIKKGGRFRTNIDVKLRIKYYIISYLRRLEREEKYPAFDDIVLYIMPLLKNGLTPEEQTILSVLEDLADRITENTWKLKQEGQLTLF